MQCCSAILNFSISGFIQVLDPLVPDPYLIDSQIYYFYLPY